MREIPSSMATQHPDNATKPYWNHRSFITATDEVRECFLCYSDLGIDEYNWDWEGKFVDEAVVDRLLHSHLSYFKHNPLGRKKFLTFRLPNPRVERHFRIARAFMVVVTSSQLIKSLGFSTPPIFETILPLTETAQEIIDIQEAFRQLVSLEHRLLKMETSVRHIEIIPLFEQVGIIIDSADLIRNYIKIHKKQFGFTPKYLRPYCARSDPALNSGLIPTMMALKTALSSYALLEQESGVRLFPMVGTGSLPFRGGVTPENIDSAIKEYAGVSTLILQSGFRYDYPKITVKEAIGKIRGSLQRNKARRIESKQIAEIKKIISFFENPYRATVEGIASVINQVSSMVGKRRERMQHIGLFGYSRGVGNVRLPRAIPFTAALYSLGIPPEFIGTGRGLERTFAKGLDEVVAYCYLNLRQDLERVGGYLNIDNLEQLARHSPHFADIVNDVKYVEKRLGIDLGPKTTQQLEHKKLTEKIYQQFKDGKNFSQLITQTGVLRKSLG